MAATLENNVRRDGYWDHDLVKVLENLRDVVNELQADHATTKAAMDALRTRCVTPPNFEIDTNFDIQNGDAFEIESSGVQATIATDQNFDTGTATVIATNAYWAAGILSIDIDGTTYVNWGAEAASEAAAITNLAAVTASGEVTCGYVTVHAAAGQDWVAGTDALTTGTGGQVAQATNYYNNQYVGAGATAAPATLTNSTAITLNKG